MIARRFVWRVPRDGVLGQTMQLLDGQEIEDRERLQTLIIGRLAWTVFALVPIFAALLRLLYRRRERYFAPHLVFALHFHTLGFLLLGVGIGLDTLFGVRPYLSNLTFLAVALMLFPSLRRVYMEGRFRTIGKQVVLLLAYGVAVVVGLSALMAITALAA